jgi:hypothetical protein
MIAFAAKAGSDATDGQGTNSPFTAALLKHLPTPGLDIRLVFGRVRDDVLSSTRRRQEPFVYGSLGGSDVALVAAPAAPAPANASVDVRRDYELAGQVGTPEAWAAFLVQYPTGFYADLARQQRSKLLNAAARQQADQDASARKRDEEERRARAAEAERQRLEREKTERDKAQRQEATRAEEEQRRLAREQAEREKSAAEAPKTQVAVVPPAAEPVARPQPPQLPRADLVQAIRKQLKRVGCYDGLVDDNWEERGLQRSIGRFVRYAKFSGAADEPNADFLDALRGSDPGVCPLECGPRETERNGRCVAKGCPDGERMSKRGACIEIESRAPARHKSTAKHREEKPASEARTKRADSGRSGWMKCSHSVGTGPGKGSGSADARRFAMIDSCTRGGR